MVTANEIEKIIDSMDLDDLVGQLLNYDMTVPVFDMADFENVCRETRPGSLYFCDGGKIEPYFNDGSNKFDPKEREEQTAGEEKRNRELCDVAAKYTKVRPVVTTDGGTAKVGRQAPYMAWGASDRPDLLKRWIRNASAYFTQVHHHILLRPEVDINMNPDNPLINTRAFSDCAEHNIKMGKAFVEGALEGGMIPCAKHFPGDGVDSRNQHVCTTVNSLGKQEWMDTFGKTFKAMFDAGCPTVMCAHISLPSWQTDDEKVETVGFLPCSLSKSLMTDLLKGKLGFEGCIISDAMSMVGAVAVCPRNELAVRYIKAGGDMVLFAHPEDHKFIKDAVLSGEITMDRIRDAVRRILKVKNMAGLLDNTEKTVEITEEPDDIIKNELPKNLINVVRNFDNIFPLDLKPGARILMVSMMPFPGADDTMKAVFKPMHAELEKMGYTVTEKFTPFMHTELANICEDFDCVLINSAFANNWPSTTTLRMPYECNSPFWDGFGLKHPKIVYASFGSPYQLFEWPFLKTYVNCFSADPYVQLAYLDALFGKAPAIGKSPVELKGLIKRTV